MITIPKTQQVLLSCEKMCSVRPRNPRSYTRHDYVDTRKILPPPSDGECVEHIFQCRVCAAQRRYGLDSVEIN